MRWSRSSMQAACRARADSIGWSHRDLRVPVGHPATRCAD
jgi:hypothetical protein